MKIIVYVFILYGIFVNAQTSDQIKQAKDYIKTTGMSLDKAKSIAKSQGYTDKQIDDVIKKEMKTNNKNNMPESSDNEKSILLKNDVFEKSNNLKTSDNLNKNEIGSKKEKVEEATKSILHEGDQNLKIIDNRIDNFDDFSNQVGNDYFGYEIFRQDPLLFQSTSTGAVDPEYLIGPGDELIVMLWGETQFRQVLNVDREGFVFIPEVGQVFVNGLNLSLLESKLFKVLSKSYASLNPQGGKATTFLDISLGNLRPLRIQVLGEVSQPGAYTVSPSATLFSSLYYFNGPTNLGSLRDIQLIRGGKKIASIDFYQYLLTGKKPKDQKLQLDDVIFIPNRLKTVSILGEVNRPGIFELKKEETLKDLMEMAGSLKVTAYLDRAQVDRVVPFDQREKLGIDRMFNDVNLEEILNGGSKFTLNDGDKIVVFSVFDLRSNVVNIEGAVSRPGSYDIGESLSLNQLIQKADGLLGDAFLDRVNIIRTNSDYSEELIKLDLRKVISGDPKDDIMLNSGDRIQVFSLTERKGKDYVAIDGHVKLPGKYPLQKNMTLYDLIFIASGLSDLDFKKDTYLSRAELIRMNKTNFEREIIPFNLDLVLKNAGKASELLKPDDYVFIYGRSQILASKNFVTITGNVKNPGQYELFEKNMTVYDLIFKAGGFGDKVYKSTVYLDRAELVRTNQNSLEKEIITFNLGEVLNKQGLANNILKPNDSIIIYGNEDVIGEKKNVNIEGRVKNPGQYELFEKNMTLYDLIFKAGGFEDIEFRSTMHLERADLIRLDSNKITKSIISFNLFEIMNNPNSEKNIKLTPGDNIRIYPKSIFKKSNTVTLEGAVVRPGQYELKTEMNIVDLILEGGGFTEKHQIYKIDITRRDSANNSNLYASNIFIEMDANYQTILNPAEKFKLNPLDFITVRSQGHQTSNQIITVSGAVNFPGSYALTGPDETISQIIQRAGGLRANAYPMASKFTRNEKEIMLDLDKILKRKKSKHDIELIDGDKIYVANVPTIIEVSGEVNVSGFYKFSKGRRVSDYISLAGGFTQNVERKDIWIQYPNGKSRKYNRFFSNPRVLDGSVIKVGTKQESEPFDSTEFAKEMASIMTDFAQLFLIISALRSS